MLKGFKDFLLRGNVLDLAVAVVVGAALYFILIVPANAAKKRFITEPADKKASEADLLIQIRDILEVSLQPGGATASSDGATPSSDGAHAMTSDKAANLAQTRE
ncbi:MAG: hypothetical protein EOP25_12925 [Rhodococcus sp. (in: high G+C Gram-positive bacteria)]|nr:MAG: hypothetical protein EOP25_12925 [Rhodococcus sp. (in: high G+C Gram-positive bacteria)]